jgi:hypothetical protein
MLIAYKDALVLALVIATEVGLGTEAGPLPTTAIGLVPIIAGAPPVLKLVALTGHLPSAVTI